jgi:hypothetical protein
MVIFVGELPEDAEYTAWDLFFTKGSIVIFRIAMTILRLLQKELLSETRSIEEAVKVINTFSETKLSRNMLLRNLESEPKKPEVERLRTHYRLEIVGNLQRQMQAPKKRQFTEAHFLKKFLLYDGLP